MTVTDVMRKDEKGTTTGYSRTYVKIFLVCWVVRVPVKGAGSGFVRLRLDLGRITREVWVPVNSCVSLDTRSPVWSHPDVMKLVQYVRTICARCSSVRV